LEKLNKEFVTSLITVILAILAIAVFIHSGASLLFYCTMAIALVVGFYNAWQISVIEGRTEKPKPKPTRKSKSRKRQ
jgi:preprotein translocase subunit SecF